jgi:hypothetical protein
MNDLMPNDKQLPLGNDTTLHGYVDHAGMIGTTIWYNGVGYGNVTMTREQAREWGNKLIALSNANYIQLEKVVLSGYSTQSFMS